MITGFGCSIPAIMATRTLQSRTDRLVTIMIIPFMSCGAKLPVYVLLCGAFFSPAMAGNILFGIYLLGIAVGLWTAWVLKSTVLGSDSEPFVMELPPYRWPTIGSVIFQAKAKALMYVKKAGTLILAAVVLIWVAGNYPKNPELDGAFALRISEIQGDSGLLPAEKERLSGELGRMLRSDQLAYSFAGRAGMFMEPVLRPIGFDWRIGIALVTGLAAKEVVVSTMATILCSFSRGGLSRFENNASEGSRIQQGDGFEPYGVCVALSSLHGSTGRDEKRGWPLEAGIALLGLLAYDSLGHVVHRLPDSPAYSVVEGSETAGPSVSTTTRPLSSALVMMSSTGIFMGAGFPSIMVMVTAGLALMCSAITSSQCTRTGSSSEVHARRPLHLGNLEHPSHGPRLPTRRFMGAPHFGQARSVNTGGSFMGSIWRCLPRLSSPLHLG